MLAKRYALFGKEFGSKHNLIYGVISFVGIVNVWSLGQISRGIQLTKNRKSAAVAQIQLSEFINTTLSSTSALRKTTKIRTCPGIWIVNQRPNEASQLPNNMKSRCSTSDLLLWLRGRSTEWLMHLVKSLCQTFYQWFSLAWSNLFGLRHSRIVILQVT